jgi:hypothetical protein
VHFILLRCLGELLSEDLLHCNPQLFEFLQDLLLFVLVILNGLSQSHFKEVVESSREDGKIALYLVIEKLEVFSPQTNLSHSQKVFRSKSLTFILHAVKLLYRAVGI